MQVCQLLNATRDKANIYFFVLCINWLFETSYSLAPLSQTVKSVWVCTAFLIVLCRIDYNESGGKGARAELKVRTNGINSVGRQVSISFFFVTPSPSVGFEWWNRQWFMTNVSDRRSRLLLCPCQSQVGPRVSSFTFQSFPVYSSTNTPKLLVHQVGKAKIHGTERNRPDQGQFTLSYIIVLH